MTKDRGIRPTAAGDELAVPAHSAVAVTRRELLWAGGLSAAALGLAACTSSALHTSRSSAPSDSMSGMSGMAGMSGAGSPSLHASGDAGGATLQGGGGQFLASKNGVLSATLTAQSGVSMGGAHTSGYGYNGSSPGPVLMAKPGDVLKIRLVNDLDVQTSLHIHGLHVSPEGNGDNPFIEIQPGSSFEYEIKIPPDHPAGTFWYHPHRHMLVADQVFRGLFGAMVITGPDEPRVDRDQVLIFSDITLDSSGAVVEPSAAEKLVGRIGQSLMVNGQQRPQLTAAPGELQRFRFVNACSTRMLTVALDGQQFTQIALDGHYLSAPKNQTSVDLSPGNRVDVLVHASAAGIFNLTASTAAMGNGGGGGFGGGGGGGGLPSLGGGTETAAVLKVSGKAVSGRSTAIVLPKSASPSGSVSHTRTIVMGMTAGGGGRFGGGGGGGSATGGMAGMSPGLFNLDGRTFDPNRDDQSPKLNTVEEWTIVNNSWMAHPFHLHVWPFTVIASSDGAELPDTPQDVVSVPALGSVRLRVPFANFTGRSVYHCHILDHEDAGMMAVVHVK